MIYRSEYVADISAYAVTITLHSIYSSNSQVSLISDIYHATFSTSLLIFFASTLFFFFFFLMIRLSPRSTLFPYTTLFFFFLKSTRPTYIHTLPPHAVFCF